MFDSRFLYENDTIFVLFCNILLSCVAYRLSYVTIENCSRLFIAAGLKGKDLGQREQTVLPEAVGFVSGIIYMMCLFVIIALPYGCSYFTGSQTVWSDTKYLIEYLAALLSITSMILLGFSDDVLNIRWRYKMLLPFLASIPLVLVYIINEGSTTVIMPIIARFVFGKFVNIGVLHYVFLICITVFCCNTINIYAGINGLEVGQSIVIAVSWILFEFVEQLKGSGESLTPIFILIPFLSVSLALFQFNKYPAKVFVGDTYCYFAGMTFAVAGILSHNCKTLLLFFLPQIINFLLSIPQLISMIPCPRHRLPMYKSSLMLLKYANTTCRLDQETMNRTPSETTFKLTSLDLGGCIVVGLMSRFGMATISGPSKDASKVIVADNLTLLNFVLRKYGPMKEDELLRLLLRFQVAASAIAFVIRYPIAWVLYHAF